MKFVPVTLCHTSQTSMFIKVESCTPCKLHRFLLQILEHSPNKNTKLTILYKHKHLMKIKSQYSGREATTAHFKCYSRM